LKQYRVHTKTASNEPLKSLCEKKEKYIDNEGKRLKTMERVKEEILKK
jgi:hypothetical protein